MISPLGENLKLSHLTIKFWSSKINFVAYVVMKFGRLNDSFPKRNKASWVNKIRASIFTTDD